MKTCHMPVSGLLIAALFMGLSCRSSEVKPSDRVALHANESARLGSNVNVTVKSILDSRCPANVTCVWEGQAKVAVHLSKDQEAQDVQLILGPDLDNRANKRPDSTGVTLANETYKVVLREVNPYPGTGSANQEQTATVQVSKL